MWNKPKNAEHISFVLSNLKRENAAIDNQLSLNQPSRRRMVTQDGSSIYGSGNDGMDVSGHNLNLHHHNDIELATQVDTTLYVDGFAPPPKLKPRRSCCLTITFVWALVVCVVVFVVSIEIYDVHRAAIEEAKQFEKRVARDFSIHERVAFGVWDREGRLTPLQLQVGVSMALGVRASDDDVHITQLENAFFGVSVEHGTTEEVDFVNSDGFIASLNEHLEHYEASCVLSQGARLLHKSTD